MKIKKPLEPILPGTTDFRPRLARYGRDAELPALRSLKAAMSTQTKRTNTKSGSKGAGRIRATKGFNQRVVVKARVVKMNGSASAKRNLRAHVQYLVRSGVSKTGESPSFFTQDERQTKQDINKEISKWGDDKHHFRFIVSPEKGRDLELESYTRSVIKGLEADLNEKLTWFATCHYNTDEPHVHVVVRGIGKDGNSLHIAKDYIRHGFRELAQKEATKCLGERNELDLKQTLSREITALKWTGLDSSIENDIKRSPDSSIRLYKDFTHQTEITKVYKEAKLQRLQFLKKHDLSIEVSPGVWRLSNDAKATLNSVAKLEKVQRIVAQHLTGRAALSSLVLYEKGEELQEPIRGEVLGVGYQDGFQTQKYILISADDGRNHFIEPSRFSVQRGFSLRKGQIVNVYHEQKTHSADEVIKRFSDERRGSFDEKAFQEHVQQKVANGSWELPPDVFIEDYLERYKTRVSSLEDAGILTRTGDRRYLVPEDLHEKVKVLDEKLGKRAHVTIGIESFLSIEQQVKHLGATWLDSLGLEETAISLTPFSNRVQNAIKTRQEHLTQMGIPAQERNYQTLKTREENKLKEGLIRIYGKEVSPPQGVKIEGVVRRYKILGTGVHQVIKTKDGFIARKLSNKDARIPIGSSVQIETSKRGLRIKEILSREQVNKTKSRSR